MDIKDFFYNGGIMKCVDRTESDVVIEMCKSEGLPVFLDHDPNGHFHGALWRERDKMITFVQVGGEAWERGTPFCEWIALMEQSSIVVEDLI